jgi:hypothetical protein
MLYAKQGYTFGLTSARPTSLVLWEVARMVAAWWVLGQREHFRVRDEFVIHHVINVALSVSGSLDSFVRQLDTLVTLLDDLCLVLRRRGGVTKDHGV